MVSIQREGILVRQRWAADFHYSKQSDLGASLSGLLSITRIKRYIPDQSIEH
jgi:hypothetical protein